MSPSRCKNYCLITGLFLLMFSNINSQQLNVKGGLFGFFDNREYFNYYENDQTIFGTRAFITAGIKINPKTEFVLGLDGLYEFGGKLNDDYVKPIAYIHHQMEVVDLYIGSFYREPIINMPDVLLNDTLTYYKPNVEGIYLAYNKTKFKHNVWIDWVSRQSKADKEIFHLGGSGSLILNWFFYKHDFIFTHYALTANANTNEHIRDNGGIYSRIGAGKSKFSFLDTISISTGFVISYDRNRSITPLTYYKGMITEISIAYKAFGLKYLNYSGTGQLFITGDPLYEAKQYNRIDFIWRILNRRGIKGEIEFSFHIINDFLDYSQKFTLRADIEYVKDLKTRTN